MGMAPASYVSDFFSAPSATPALKILRVSRIDPEEIKRRGRKGRRGRRDLNEWISNPNYITLSTTTQDLHDSDFFSVTSATSALKCLRVGHPLVGLIVEI